MTRERTTLHPALGRLVGRLVAAAASGVLLVALAGCGGDDAEPETTTSPTSSPTSDSSASSEQSSEPPSEQSSEPSQGQTPAETAALVEAGRTALTKVGDGAVYSVESENEGGGVWEVAVVTPDGTQHEMYVARDGGSVTRGPTVDGRSAKYRDRVQAAKLDFEQAVQVILEEVPGARFEELNLDDERGTVVWEADVVDASGQALSVEIDAASGEVRENKTDS